jgi:hypothetical protein
VIAHHVDALWCRLSAGAGRLGGIVLDGCNQITNDGVVAIADNCFYLTLLNLRNCRELSDPALLSFTSASLRWRRLETVRARAVARACNCCKITVMSSLSLSPPPGLARRHVPDL